MITELKKKAKIIQNKNIDEDEKMSQDPKWKALPLEEYCQERQWFEEGIHVTATGGCDDIPLRNPLIQGNGETYNQIVLGRVTVLDQLNYYNCRNFQILGINKWNKPMNDFFIMCSWLHKDYDFPIRFVTQREIVEYTPVIASFSQEEWVTRVERPGLTRDYDTKPHARFLNSTHPILGSPIGTLFNRELCQLYRFGMRIWQCVTYPYENIFFMSFKQNYLDYTSVTISGIDDEGNIKIDEHGPNSVMFEMSEILPNGLPYTYTFQDVTQQYRFTLDEDPRNKLLRSKRRRFIPGSSKKANPIGKLPKNRLSVSAPLTVITSPISVSAPAAFTRSYKTRSRAAISKTALTRSSRRAASKKLGSRKIAWGP